MPKNVRGLFASRRGAWWLFFVVAVSAAGFAVFSINRLWLSVDIPGPSPVLTPEDITVGRRIVSLYYLSQKGVSGELMWLSANI